MYYGNLNVYNSLILNKIYYCEKLFPNRRFTIFRYKIKVMSTSAFLILLPVVVLGLILVRVFWLEIFSVLIVVRTLFYLAVLSFSSAIIWSVWINDDPEGFWRCWLFFSIIYIVAAALLYGILLDIFDMGVELIRYIFRIR